MLIERLEDQARRNGRVSRAHDIALSIDVLDAEGGVDRSLIGIGRGAGEIVEVEAGEELILRGKSWSMRMENWSALVTTFDAVA